MVAIGVCSGRGGEWGGVQRLEQDTLQTCTVHCTFQTERGACGNLTSSCTSMGSESRRVARDWDEGSVKEPHLLRHSVTRLARDTHSREEGCNDIKYVNQQCMKLDPSHPDIIPPVLFIAPAKFTLLLRRIPCHNTLAQALVRQKVDIWIGALP